MSVDVEINIVDAIMGAGKTTAIMNYINDAPQEEHFLVITPFLEEIERYQEYCSEKNFKQPNYRYQNKAVTKLNDLKKMIKKEENIVSTHALFQKFDKEIIELCKSKNYTLIMDEVAEVVTDYDITQQDIEILVEKYTNINPVTKRLEWKEEYSKYTGKFDKEKKICESGNLTYFGNNQVIWAFPVEAFISFKKIFILTFMFDKQIQKYYYDYYGLKYKYWSVSGDNPSNYHLSIYDSDKRYFKYDYSKLIHICDHESVNKIGDGRYSLSKSWYTKNKSRPIMEQLKNNTNNYFKNIVSGKSRDILWTTFKDYQIKLSGKGYTKGYLPLTSRATNKYKNRVYVAYLANRYVNTMVKNFFVTNGIKVDENGYALSEMLQFIWRSAIRDGKEIWVYIPSIRMRTLLQTWITENSVNEETPSLKEK